MSIPTNGAAPPADHQPVVHRCEHPGCTADGVYGKHEMKGGKIVKQHWWCWPHKPD